MWKKLIWEITKQQDPGPPQVDQANSPIYQFKINVLVWRDNEILHYAFCTVLAISFLYSMI